MKRKFDLSTGLEVTRTDLHEVDETCLMGANPGYIEAQEAKGQQQLAKSSQLPSEGLTINRMGKKTETVLKKILESAGGTILRETRDDPIFVDVILPPGWKVNPTDHSMWSDLLDASGKKRAAIFYKAAFYDRSAFIRDC